MDKLKRLRVSFLMIYLGVKLYALVNNAGISGMSTEGTSTESEVINTNFLGPKRVTEALIDLIDSRIVNTSSEIASRWLRDQDADTKKLYSNPDITFEELDASVKANVAAKNFIRRIGTGYGLSKAALCSLTLIQAKVSPDSCNPTSHNFFF